MKRPILFLALCSLGFVAACDTENTRARSGGETITKRLPDCKKLEFATWKDDNGLWMLTRDFRPGERPEMHELVEDNDTFGHTNGRVIFIERCSRMAEPSVPPAAP